MSVINKFIGRKTELERLRRRLELGVSSFIVCKGRRRIGKSRLILEYSKNFDNFYQFHGLAPKAGEKSSHIRQLKAFSEQFAKQFHLPTSFVFSSWTEVFDTLASQSKNKGKVLIFLDEISWMAEGDKDFSQKLKVGWDTALKNNNNLVLVVCGSVSSWIDKHILENTGFVGRVGLTIALKELELHECNEFWGNRKNKISSKEKAKILSITGGVPRYLEEVNPKLTAEENIRELCFTKSGLLFSEFENIFNEQFAKRAGTYKQILLCLIRSRLTTTEIGKKINMPPSGYLSSCLNDLEEAGFIRQDATSSLGGRYKKLYRISDNYTRFYLYYILPNTDKINQGLFEFSHLENLPNWESIMGLQFENSVLNNISYIITKIQIPKEKIEFAGTLYQTSSNDRTQVDLLVTTKHNTYIIEVKNKNKIGKSIIGEIESKIQKINLSDKKSIRTILIYEGGITNSLKDSDYFSKIVSFSDLLQNGSIPS